MNIFERKQLLKQSSIMNYVQSAKRNYTFNSKIVSFTITVPAEILREINFWTLTKEEVQEKLTDINITSEVFDLKQLEILECTGKNDETIQVAEITYYGTCGENREDDYIVVADFATMLGATPPYFSPTTFENIRGRRSEYGTSLNE